MKREFKAAVVLVGMVLLAGLAHAQNDAGESEASATVIRKENTDRGLATVAESVGERAGRVASAVGHKVETVSRKVGAAVQRGAEKTGHALERAGHWVESKVGSVSRSSQE